MDNLIICLWNDLPCEVNGLSILPNVTMWIKICTFLYKLSDPHPHDDNPGIICLWNIKIVSWSEWSQYLTKMYHVDQNLHLKKEKKKSKKTPKNSISFKWPTLEGNTEIMIWLFISERNCTVIWLVSLSYKIVITWEDKCAPTYIH